MDRPAVGVRLPYGEHFTVKQRPLRDEHLLPFIESYNADDRSARVESERFRPYSYDELVARDKANLDIIWLKDPSLTEADEGSHRRSSRGSSSTASPPHSPNSLPSQMPWLPAPQRCQIGAELPSNRHHAATRCFPNFSMIT